MFSSSMKVLLADRQAWSFCRKIKAPKVPAGEAIPKPIGDMTEAIEGLGHPRPPLSHRRTSFLIFRSFQPEIPIVFMT